MTKTTDKSVQIEQDGDIIKRVQIDEKLSDEVGQYVSVFHYRLEKEVEAGMNHVTGEPCEAYCQVKLEHMNPISEESYKKIHEEEYRLQLAIKGKCDPQYITPISKEQYEAEIGE